MSSKFIINKKCCEINKYFCYCCGQHNKISLNAEINKFWKDRFKEIFGYYPKNLEKFWTGKVFCANCRKLMKKYLEDKKIDNNISLPFRPTLWNKPNKDHSNCFICQFKFHEFNPSEEFKIYASNCSIVLSKNRNLNEENEANFYESKYFTECEEVETEEMEVEDLKDSDFEPIKKECNLNLFDQPSLNDFLRGGSATIQDSLYYASVLKARGMCTKDVKVEYYKTRYKEVLPFIDQYQQDEFITPFVKDYAGLFRWFGVEYKADDWRLFIDSNINSLKCCLLPNLGEETIHYYGDEFPVVPILISTNLKEKYECLEIIMKLIDYKTHNWLICCDLKMVNILCGLGPAQSLFCCYLCTFRSTEYSEHYLKEYELREDHQVGQLSATKEALIDRSKVIIPPLHIMLGLYSSFIKSIKDNEDVFNYLNDLLPNVSKAKHLEGILNGPDIKKLIKDTTFYNFLNEEQKFAWESFVLFNNEILSSNSRPLNYLEIAENLKISYGRIKKNMSLKVHLATQHVDQFQKSCAKFSEQPGEKLHQDFKKIEVRFRSSGLNAKFLADYLWNLKRETNNEIGRKNKRQSFPVPNF